MTTPHTELLHATLALIADALEAQNLQPLHTELARSVVTTAGTPTHSPNNREDQLAAAFT
jgi:hypothetical protein